MSSPTLLVTAIGFVVWRIVGASFFADIARMVLLLIVTFLVHCAVLSRCSIWAFVGVFVFLRSFGLARGMG